MPSKKRDAPTAGPPSPEVPPPETWAALPGIKTLGGESRLVRWWRVMAYGRDPTHVRWLGEKVGTLRVSITADRKWFKKRGRH